MRKFRRIQRSGSCIGGVCAGLAYTFGISTFVVRVLWCVSLISTPFTAIVYFILCVNVPEQDVPEDFADRVNGLTRKRI